MQHQYEYFMSDTLDLPKDVWLPFSAAGQPLSYPKGKLLYSQGEQADCFYYLCAGRIKTFISSTDGNERLLTIYKKGDILGEASFFDGRPRVSSAELMTDARVVSIDRPALERCLRQSPDLTFSLLKYLSATVWMLSTHLDAASFLPADVRIVRLLLNMDPGGEHRIACTHEELSYTLGLSRVTVSRVLSALAKRGWIRPGYRSVTLTDLDAMERMVTDIQ